MGTTFSLFLRLEAAFDPDDIRAMSMALDDVCDVLKLHDDPNAREVMAERIIDLARRGERSPTRLRDRLLSEAGLGEYTDRVRKSRDSGDQSSGASP